MSLSVEIMVIDDTNMSGTTEIARSCPNIELVVSGSARVRMVDATSTRC